MQQYAITAVGDVRSSPYSNFNPQYNRENLQKVLKENGIAYVFLGRELGPRSEDPACYLDGQVQYARLVKTGLFRQGIGRLFKGMKTHRIALMCAEKDPITCHRMILICRVLRRGPFQISHILEDGSTEALAESEKRLLLKLKLRQLGLFDTLEDLIQRAYDIQSEKIAYVRDDKERSPEEEETENYTGQG